jgi:hypothetical protein
MKLLEVTLFLPEKGMGWQVTMGKLLDWHKAISPLPTSERNPGGELSIYKPNEDIDLDPKTMETLSGKPCAVFSEIVMENLELFLENLKETHQIIEDFPSKVAIWVYP